MTETPAVSEKLMKNKHSIIKTNIKGRYEVKRLSDIKQLILKWTMESFQIAISSTVLFSVVQSSFSDPFKKMTL